MTSRARDIGWQRDAACRTTRTAVFFPGRTGNAEGSYAQARALCVACPVLEPCREFAMSFGPELTGMWAGLTEKDRRALRRRRRRVA